MRSLPRKDANKRNHLSEIFKNGNVSKLILTLIAKFISMKKTGRLIVLFFTFL